MVRFGVEVVKSRFGYMKNYSYVLYDRQYRRAAIIDPAWDIDAFANIVEDLQLHVTAVLLTHSHQDHVNLVEELVRRYHPVVYMSEREIRYYDYHCPNLRPLLDGEEILLGGGVISCMSTPGHSYGSMCYLTERHLFSGDTIFIEGCGMCSSRGADPYAMFESIQAIKQRVPAHLAVYPGHSFGKEPGYTLEYLEKNNIYFQFDEKQVFVRFRMRKNQPNWFAFQ